MNKKAKYLMFGFVIVAVAALFVPISACGDNKEPADPSQSQTSGGTDPDVDFEQLESVMTNPDMDEQIVHYKGFTVSFNASMHMPNWVAWTITPEELENPLSRVDNFRPDPNVPGCATLEDYKYSGYDRGHMAPSGDMRWDAEAMDNSCYLTNICPQLHALNDGTWKNLEEKCRSVAKRDGFITVVCGPVLTEGFTNYIGTSPVPVPPKFWKVVYTPGGKKGAMVLGFLMPHFETITGGMQSTAVSVDEIEALTGHDFFHNLPDDIEKNLEKQVNFTYFSTGQ